MIAQHALQILIKGKDLSASTLKKAGVNVQKLASIIKDAQTAAIDLAKNQLQAVKDLATGATSFVATLLGIPSSIAAITQKVTDYAAELEVARRAMWGIAGEAAPAMLEALQKSTLGMMTELPLLRKYTSAYMLLGKEIADRLPEAMLYLTKISAATGYDLGNLTDRLTRSVGRLSTRWMAMVGVVVPVEEATKRASQMFGKLESELTYTEKQAGMMDRTLEKLAARTAALPEVLGTTIQMSTALSTTWKDLWGDATTFFLPVAREIYKVLQGNATAISNLISETGGLYIPIRRLTALFTVLVEMIGNAIPALDELGETGASAIGDFVNRMIDMGAEAFEWGANLINNFAIGMTEAGTTALIGAIHYISNILTEWLAPGSAPKIVSNILDWGAAAFTEYLRGFTMADFDILEGVQRPLKRALQTLVDLKEMGAIDAAEFFIDISEGLAEAIDTGDFEEVFKKLAEIPGGYGDSLIELLKRQKDLAVAVGVLAAAEERLTRAKEDEETSNDKLSQSAREYNKLLRAGASPAVLKAKLAEAEASYDALKAARLEIKEAEKAKKLAAEDLKLKREQAKMQQRLLDQLITMSQALIDLAKATEEGAELPEIEFPDVHLPPIDQAFEDLTDRIRERFAQLGRDIVAAWEDSEVFGLVDKLKTTWAESALGQWVADFIADVDEQGLAMAFNNLYAKLVNGFLNMLGMDSVYAKTTRMDLATGLQTFVQYSFAEGADSVNILDVFTAIWHKLANGFANMLGLPDLYASKTHKTDLKTGLVTFTESSAEQAADLTTWGEFFSTLWGKILDGFLKMLGLSSPTATETSNQYMSSGYMQYLEASSEEGAENTTFTKFFEIIWKKLEPGISNLVFKIGQWLGKLIGGTGGKKGLDGEFEDEATGLGTTFVAGLVSGLTGGLAGEETNWSSAVTTFIGIAGKVGADVVAGGPIFALVNVGGHIMDSLLQGITAEDTVVGQTITNMLDGIVGLFEDLGEGDFTSIGRKMKEGILRGFEGIREGFKPILNCIIWFIEIAANSIIDGINAILRGLNMLPQFNIGLLSHISLQRMPMAKGGMVTAVEQLALLHRNEVVLPLEDPRTTRAMAEAMRGAIGGGGPAAGGGNTYITYELNFGRDSVRSDADIMEIVERVKRATTLRGVRGALT